MVYTGSIPLTEAEKKAVEKLGGQNPDEQLTLTRRDPGETGPLLIHAGDQTWEIAADGKRKKVK